MKKEGKLLIRGIGIGVIATSLLFYCISIFSVPQNTTITNEEVIIRAKELGMIFITDLQDNQNTMEDTKTNSDTDDNADINNEILTDDSENMNQETN